MSKNLSDLSLGIQEISHSSLSQLGGSQTTDFETNTLVGGLSSDGARDYNYRLRDLSTREAEKPVEERRGAGTAGRSDERGKAVDGNSGRGHGAPLTGLVAS